MLMKVTEKLILFIVSNIQMSGATCETRHKEKCLEAARSAAIGTLKSSGRCSQKNYLKFNHVCLVTNYSPDVDHCCCIQENLIMCCPYRQTWNHFRCLDSVDTVGELASPSPEHYDITFITSTVIGCLIGVLIVSYFVLLLRKRLLKGHWCNGDDIIISQNHDCTHDQEIHPNHVKVTKGHPPQTEKPRQFPREMVTLPGKKNPSTSEGMGDVTSSCPSKNLIVPPVVEGHHQHPHHHHPGYRSISDRVDFVILDCRGDPDEVWQKPQKVKVVKLTRFQDGSSLL